MPTGMRILFVAIVALGAFLADPVLADDPNTLTEEERQAGFVRLFNGRDFRGWEPKHLMGLRDETWKTEGPWRVEEGAMYVPCESPFPLVYCIDAFPPDFDLRFEWKESPASNSSLQGHFSLGTAGTMTPNGWSGRLWCGYHANGSIRFLTDEIDIPMRIMALSGSMTPSKDARRPAGQWNTARMVCKGPLVQQWLNGEKIVNLDLRGPWWAGSDDEQGKAILEAWFKVRTEKLCLEIRPGADSVWYRGLKIRAISEEEISQGEQDRPLNGTIQRR